ncbi:MAG: disulfide bond formation protein B [Patescibacteria group bacterium]
MKKLLDFAKKYILYAIFLVALAAMMGSLYFGEVMKIPLCTLCWYQRIAMYPLVVVLAVGILWDEAKVHLYALPFAVIGLIISIYHNLIYAGIIPEVIKPCTVDVPCTTKFIEFFGFVSIPLLSLLGFIFITGGMIFHWKYCKTKAT